jgi:hypothetical protein
MGVSEMELPWVGATIGGSGSRSRFLVGLFVIV